MPSVPVAAVAALIAFFILAAPRLGRRLPGCAGAEPAQHVPLLDRPPGLRAVSPRPDASAAPPSAWCHTDSSKGDKMKRAFIALTVALLLLLVAGVGTAAADPPASQGWGQWAESQEDAGAAVGAAPQGPNGRERLGRRNRTRPSSGAAAGNANESSTGAQSRTRALAPPQEVIGARRQDVLRAVSDARATQVRDLGCRPAGRQERASSRVSTHAGSAPRVPAARGPVKERALQVIGQSADNEQDATALAATEQEKPSNENVSIRVLSPGDDGCRLTVERGVVRSDGRQR